MPESERERVLARLGRTARTALADRLAYDWTGLYGSPKARVSQLPPAGAWRICAYVTGRGYGKTRTLSEWAHEQAARHAGDAGFIGARTLKDARKTILGNPRSGVLSTHRPWNPCRFLEHRGQVVWANGAVADVHTSEEPDASRGGDYAWGVADEVATWKRTVDFQGNTAWTNLQFGLRAGAHPQMLVGTTPRRGSTVIKKLLEEAKDDRGHVVLVRGSMMENAANLPDAFLEYIRDTYGGTHLGRQEIDGEYLEEIEGALVTHDMLEDHRTDEDAVPDLVRVAVGVDPSGGATGDTQGIVATGLGVDDEGYLLEDATCRLNTEGWARRAVEVYWKHEADVLVAEKNFGGDMVRAVIHQQDANVNVKLVTASRGKHVRFEPVAMLHQQGRLHHVGSHPQLEDEECGFTAAGYEGDESPGRADAEAWTVHELMIHEKRGLGWAELYGEDGVLAST